MNQITEKELRKFIIEQKLVHGDGKTDVVMGRMMILTELEKLIDGKNCDNEKKILKG